MRYARRIDGNHNEIVRGLAACGFRVEDLSGLGKGVPDASVEILDGFSIYLEIKDPKQDAYTRKLTKAEEAWFKRNKYISFKVESLDEAIRIIREQKTIWTARLKNIP